MSYRHTAVQTKARIAFAAAKTEFDTMLQRLAELSADHFNTNPDEINWGHVGTMQSYCTKMREITNSAFKEGENEILKDK